MVQRFAPQGTPDFASLLSLPTVFVEETTGEAGQVARIGRIINARITDRDLHLEYAFDHGAPPIPQADLIRLASALDIRGNYRGGIGELTTTHWAVKDADLFQVLFMEISANQGQPEAEDVRGRERLPNVFTLRNPAVVDADQLSAMMPFSGFDAVYNAITHAATQAGMRCNRADNVWENHAIIQDIVDLIDRSAIVVCDCTGRNPNVFYEIGIAHSLGKEVILITQDGNDVPFDLTHLRHIRYQPHPDGLQKLASDLASRIRYLRAQ
ncbi:hypothetical protein FQZ97_947490 [compost metagenome]